MLANVLAFRKTPRGGIGGLRHLATFRFKSRRVSSTATSLPLPTPRPLPAVQVPPTPAQIQIDVPFRELRGATVGTGVFTQVTSSDGQASFSQDDLNTNPYRILRIRPEENQDGCGVSIYTTDKVWFGSSANTVFTVNGKEVGRLSVDTGRHGYVANWSVRVGDKVCAVGFAPSGYYIIMGPDLYYHDDSYCYRGNC